MKQTYFSVIIALFFTIGINAQIFTEDFSNGVNGWSEDGSTDHWPISNTNTAGGIAPELVFRWDPQITGTFRYISPSIDLSGMSSVVLKFNHSINDYSSGYNVGVATRSNGGAWNVVWQMVGTDISEVKEIVIDNSDVNTNDFQFCFFFTGNSYYINYWYIDNVTISDIPNLDLQITSNNNIPYSAPNNINFECTVKNNGLTVINSFDISYSIDGGTPVTENVSGLNLNTTDSYSYTFTNSWNANTSGAYNATFTISNINGNATNDDDTANNMLSKSFSIASQTTANTPLFESFTSSTCGPCAGFNSGTFNPFMNSHTDIAVVKYQMSWPSPGDPYYTDEGGVRRTYYGVNGIPNLFGGGKNVSTNSSSVNASYTSELGKQAFFEIQNAHFNTNGNDINIAADIDPYISGNFNVYTVVIEKLTTGNVGNNGETQFENVMMKMLPDGNGSNVNFASGTPYNIAFTQDMSTTNVEEMSDLAVVIFIQDMNTGTVLQAKYLDTESTASTNDLIFNNVTIFPNPTNGILNIQSDKILDVQISNLLGKVVYSNKNLSNGQINLSNLDNGVYFVHLDNGINKGVKKIVLTK